MISIVTVSRSQNLFRIVEGEKRGFIDSTGHVVVSPRFRYAEDFSNSLALVSARMPIEESDSAPSSWGYIDSTGAMRLHPRFGYGRSFSGGLAAVRENDPGTLTNSIWGFIDTTGHAAIVPQYYSVGDFSEGLAWV
ncbi:MAG: WG repeat-containing protein, partial [Bacteroidota bacterium]